MRVIIIGAGMAGIAAVIKLRAAGFDDIVVYEKADRLGGTWRENTYPGIACDVPAHLYTYSFEPNPDWSHTFAPGAEIQAYFEHVAEKYAVLPLIRFNEAVTECVYRDGGWDVTTATGRSDRAAVLIAASGVLHYPNMAAIRGRDRFAGALFHSARWDHDVPLDGRRVGVIGTGSTAIQITSALVDRVARYKLFQRTAQWIMPGENRPYSDADRARFAREPQLIEKIRRDMHQSMIANLGNAVIDADSPAMHAVERACRENLEHNVRDPELRERLRPTYRAGCKRLVFSPDFYDAIQHPNAELVTAGIDRIEERGVITNDGALHELDVLVFATGFRADRFIRPTVVRGEGGIDLDDVWADRPIAYLSLSVPGFPNFFMLNGPNGPVGNFSLIQIAEFQIGYIRQLLERIRAGECRGVCASAAATADFDARRIEAAKSSIWSTGCKSWYLDKHGVPASWPWSYSRFAEVMQQPDLAAFDRVA